MPSFAVCCCVEARSFMRTEIWMPSPLSLLPWEHQHVHTGTPNNEAGVSTLLWPKNSLKNVACTFPPFFVFRFMRLWSAYKYLLFFFLFFSLFFPLLKKMWIYLFQIHLAIFIQMYARKVLKCCNQFQYWIVLGLYVALLEWMNVIKRIP